MALDPRIGLLSSGQYYCFQNGYAEPELRGSLAEVEAALGISGHTGAPRQAQRWNTYEVTVKPLLVTYAGPDTFCEYRVEVVAVSRAAAIKAIREARQAVEGRYGVPATYRARKKA